MADQSAPATSASRRHRRGRGSLPVEPPAQKPPKPVSGREELFCAAYARGASGTKAVEIAGYGARTPLSRQRRAHQLKREPHIAYRIREIQREDRDLFNRAFHQVMIDQVAIATADLGSIYDEDGAMLHPKDWPEETRRALQSIKLDDKGGVQYKLGDKTKAADWIAKVQGAYAPEKHEVNSTLKIAHLIVACEEGREHEDEQVVDAVP